MYMYATGQEDISTRLQLLFFSRALEILGRVTNFDARSGDDGLEVAKKCFSEVGEKQIGYSKTHAALDGIKALGDLCQQNYYGGDIANHINVYLYPFCYYFVISKCPAQYVDETHPKNIKELFDRKCMFQDIHRSLRAETPRGPSDEYKQLSLTTSSTESNRSGTRAELRSPFPYRTPPFTTDEPERSAFEREAEAHCCPCTIS